MEVGGEGEHIHVAILSPPERPALRWAAMRAILMLHNCEGQSHKTVSTNHNFWRERRAEAVSNRGPSAYQPNALPLGQTGSLWTAWWWSWKWCLMSSDVNWHIRDKLWPSAEAWFDIALRPRKPEDSLGRTAQDGHLDSHTAPELWMDSMIKSWYL